MLIPIHNQNLIAILGLESLPDAQKVSILNKASELVQKRLLLKIFDLLTPSEQSELGALLDKGDETGIQGFVEHHVPNMPELVEQEVLQVKSEVKAWVDDILKE